MTRVEAFTKTTAAGLVLFALFLGSRPTNEYDFSESAGILRGNAQSLLNNRLKQDPIDSSAGFSDEVLDTISRATVRLTTSSFLSLAQCSGSIVGRNEESLKILTNRHCVDNLGTGSEVIVSRPAIDQEQLSYRITTVITSPKPAPDLALLNLKVISPNKHFDTKPLDMATVLPASCDGCLASGYPGAYNTTPRMLLELFGDQSGQLLYRRIANFAAFRDEDYITNLTVSPGSSGSAVVNRDGQIVGAIYGGVREVSGKKADGIAIAAKLTKQITDSIKAGLVGK